MEIKINAQLIRQIINTLKGIKVRGYDSMDKLVGLVILFENILHSAEQEPVENSGPALVEEEE